MSFPLEEVTVMMTAPVSKIKYTICPLTSILTVGSYRPISIEPGSFQSESVSQVVVKASNRDFCFIVATVQALFLSFCPWCPLPGSFILLLFFFLAVGTLVTV